MMKDLCKDSFILRKTGNGPMRKMFLIDVVNEKDFFDVYSFKHF